MPDYSTAKIDITKNYFRINQAFTKGNGAPDKYYFWFRLTPKNLYYSTNDQAINVLGSISSKLLVDVVPMKVYSVDSTCFKIIDKEQHNWKLCAKDMDTKNNWVCKIKQILGFSEENCRSHLLDDSQATVLTKKITQPIILIPMPSKTCNEGWDYQRKGDDWECDCSEGKEQSPIDLPEVAKAVSSPVKPVFQYDEVTPEFKREGSSKKETIKLQYDDAVLKIQHDSFGKIVTLDGSIYNAQEIIFHTPSEHTIKGKRYDMEIQIIHFGETKGDIAKQVILSFLFERKPGVYNKFIDDIDFFNLPSPLGTMRDITHNIFIPKIFYNSDNDDLPIMKPFSFFTYQGSLTQPPCTERTIHYVAAAPIALGSTALQLFREAIKIPDLMDSNGNVKISSASPENFRNTKSLNGRLVFFYDHLKFCGPEPPKKPRTRPPGHYEKIKNEFVQYIHVEGEKPSGLPNAFVVSEAEAKGLIKGHH